MSTIEKTIEVDDAARTGAGFMTTTPQEPEIVPGTSQPIPVDPDVDPGLDPRPEPEPV